MRLSLFLSLHRVKALFSDQSAEFRSHIFKGVAQKLLFTFKMQYHRGINIITFPHPTGPTTASNSPGLTLTVTFRNVASSSWNEGKARYNQISWYKISFEFDADMHEISSVLLKSDVLIFVAWTSSPGDRGPPPSKFVRGCIWTTSESSWHKEN